mgnify:CR=1 FL=1
MPELASKSQSTGCTACVSICPCHCIQMQKDDAGFQFPEMIEQSAEKLVKMMNEKIKNPNKDINYIDGADHGYYNRENELAKQIAEFLEKYC